MDRLLGKKQHCKVLSVEDDPDYQAALMNGLSVLNYDDKQMIFLTTSSAHEALAIIIEHPDISIVFLDVVMETDQAGLHLIRAIREDLGHKLMRIVLLTGQPGMAPVNDLIAQYDIDDYWCKSDLTQAHLQTIVLSNLRTWAHLSDLQEARNGMRSLLSASQRLTSKSALSDYSYAVLDEISRIFKTKSGGVVCAFYADDVGFSKALIIAGSGDFASCVNRRLVSVIENSALTSAMTLAIEQQNHVLLDEFFVLYFSNNELEGEGYLVVMTLDHALTTDGASMLHVLCEHIRSGYRNVTLYGKLTELAYIDPVLGVHNKNWLVRDIRNMSHDEQRKTLLLMCYVEDLAYTESVLGTKYCDQLTLSLLDHLNTCFQKTPNVALLERDTFMVLIRDEPGHNEQTLERVIHTSIDVESATQSLDLTVSLVNFSDFPSYSAEQLVNVGKSTLERAKYDGVSFLAFSDTLASDMFGRYELLKDLRHAILNAEIVAYFQPKMNLKNTTLIGFEALARWVYKDGTFVSPDQFIPLAESSGLIDKLDQQMLRQSCQAINALKKIGIQVPISVNVAGNEIVRPDYFDRFKAVLAQEGVPYDMIELEITESQFIEEKSSINKHLSLLKTLGVRINIDDFGTGYSSLAYLSTLSVSTLKIDHSFVWRMDESEQDWKILQMIIGLGNSLGLSVISEGVETERQKAQLLALGCESGQGYLFSGAMTLQDTINWVQSDIQ